MEEIILSSAVVSAVITLLANFIITIINVHSNSVSENKKIRNEIVSYRYTNLYNLLIAFFSLDDETEDDRSISDADSDIFDRDASVTSKVMVFYNNTKRLCDLALPLLDKEYRNELLRLKEDCSKALSDVIEVTIVQGLKGEENKNAFVFFGKECGRFSERLIAIIYSQMDKLLEYK